MSSIVSQLVTEARQTANGAAVLNDWLGSGAQPVSLARAEARAAICVNCPENYAPNWREKMFKNPIAKAIKGHIEVKNQIGLTLHDEVRLHICKVCGCCNQLKPWVPIEHIKAHHKPEHDYPDNCWVKSEMEQV